MSEKASKLLIFACKTIDCFVAENESLREEIKRLQSQLPAKVNTHKTAPIKQLAPTDFSKWGMKCES